jgi:hypothetical protein
MVRANIRRLNLLHPRRKRKFNFKGLNMKHWVNNLSEVGNPLIRQGNEITELQSKVLNLKKEIEKLEMEIKFKEEDIFWEAKKDWDIEEITEAKLKNEKA